MNEPITFEETTGAARHLRKAFGSGPENGESYPATEEDLSRAGYTSNAETARVLNDLQQAHEATVHDALWRLEQAEDQLRTRNSLISKLVNEPSSAESAKVAEGEIERLRIVLDVAVADRAALAEKLDATEAQLRDLTAERNALRELETFVRQRPAEWLQAYRVRLTPLLAKLDALRSQPSPTREAKDSDTAEVRPVAAEAYYKETLNVRTNTEGPLAGEKPSSLYKQKTIAYARALDKLRVTPSGLGYIRDIKPDNDPAQTGSARATGEAKPAECTCSWPAPPPGPNHHHECAEYRAPQPAQKPPDPAYTILFSDGVVHHETHEEPAQKVRCNCASGLPRGPAHAGGCPLYDPASPLPVTRDLREDLIAAMRSTAAILGQPGAHRYVMQDTLNLFADELAKQREGSK
jgi:hypothetical protein